MEIKSYGRKKEIGIRLKHDEAMVLFEFFSREENNIILKSQHYAETKVLSEILAVLEKSISESFGKDYKKLLDEARKNVQGEDEPFLILDKYQGRSDMVP